MVKRVGGKPGKPIEQKIRRGWQRRRQGGARRPRGSPGRPVVGRRSRVPRGRLWSGGVPGNFCRRFWRFRKKGGVVE